VAVKFGINDLLKRLISEIFSHGPHFKSKSTSFQSGSANQRIKKLGRRFSQKKRINPQGAKREPPEIPLNPLFFKGGDYSPPFIKGRLGGISGMAKQFWSFIISYTNKEEE